jgi:hypothetical protein
MMRSVEPTLDPELDFASYYQDGGDPDRDLRAPVPVASRIVGSRVPWRRPLRARDRLAPDLVAEIAKDAGDFPPIASTIGGYILFPRNRVGQTGWTINQARGMHPAIADRFDLTLECIRRHYCDPTVDNPLGQRLAYYDDFFTLFGDFDTYVRFFLLDDLLTVDRGAVKSLMTGQPLLRFSAPAFAATVAEYAEYRRRSISFVTARNERIRQLGL